MYLFLILSSLLISSAHLQSYSILQDFFGLDKIPDDATLTPEQLAQKYHYPFEVHDVTTQDGYILQVFRIKHGKSTTDLTANPHPIFLQHGLLATAHCWMANQPDLAPAFMLADAGFDVWLGNNRGTTFGRAHQTLNPDKDKEFWNFSFIELGRYDVKGQIDYVRKFTNSKVGYVGHSQGTIQMFVALSQYEDWLNQNVTAYAAVAPVAQVGHMESSLLQFLAHSKVPEIVEALGFQEFLPRRWIINKFAEWVCADVPDICKTIMYLIVDAMPIEDNMVQTAVALNYLPGGTSVMNMNHWAQLVRSKLFQYFDYGKDENMKKYGQATPPLIELGGLHQMAIGLFSGDTDELADPTDVSWLESELQGAGVLKFNKQYKAGHFTFIIGKQMAYVADLIEFMKGYSEKVEVE